MSQHLRFYRYRIPFVKPFLSNRDRFDYREGVIIGDGKSSWSEIAPLPGFSTETIDEVCSVLEAHRKSLDRYFRDKRLDKPAENDAINGLLAGKPSLRFGISMLAEQIKAQAAGLPLYKYWLNQITSPANQDSYSPDSGSDSKDATGRKDLQGETGRGQLAHIRCNGLLDVTETHKAPEKIRNFQDSGFQTVKLKLPSDIKSAVSLIKNVCSRFRDITFRFDANRAFSHKDAENLLSALASLPDHKKLFRNIGYLEEPLQNPDAVTLSSLRRFGIPLAADESARTPDQVRELVDHRSIDAIVLKPTLFGSFREILSLIPILDSCDHPVPVTISSTFETAVGRTILAHIAAFFNHYHETDHGLAVFSILDPDIKLVPAGVLSNTPSGENTSSTTACPGKPDGDHSSEKPFDTPPVITLFESTGAGIIPDLTAHMPDPNAPFLTDGYTTITYRHLGILHRQAGNLFAALSKDKSIVGIDTGNRYQAILWIACCRLEGIPFIPFDAENPEPFGIFRPTRVILTTQETREEVKKMIQANPDRLTIPAEDYEIRKITDRTEPDPGLTYFPFPEQRPNNLFCGLLTSGSSGKPKKVPLLRRQMTSAVINSFIGIETRFYNETQVMYTDSSDSGPGQNYDRHGDSQKNSSLWGNCLPLHHAGGLTIIFRALMTGRGIFLWDRFDARQLLKDLHNNPEISHLSLVPTMLKRLLDESAGAVKPLPSSLREILVGGGPSSPGLMQSVRENKLPVIFSYGMTETCGRIAAQKRDGSSPPESAGILSPDHECIIRDPETGDAVAAGGTGILWLKGPQVFEGYLKESAHLSGITSLNDITGRIDKILDRSCFSGEWFRTDDFARLDSDGNLFIESRRTDIVISGGENISVQEVESVICRFRDVADCGVTGISDEEWGQKLVALVVPESGFQQTSCSSGESASVNELRKLENNLKKWFAGKLKPHQRPGIIIFVDRIPRTGLGKIKRDSLQRQALEFCIRSSGQPDNDSGHDP